MFDTQPIKKIADELSKVDREAASQRKEELQFHEKLDQIKKGLLKAANWLLKLHQNQDKPEIVKACKEVLEGTMKKIESDIAEARLLLERKDSLDDSIERHFTTLQSAFEEIAKY